MSENVYRLTLTERELRILRSMLVLLGDIPSIDAVVREISDKLRALEPVGTDGEGK